MSEWRVKAKLMIAGGYGVEDVSVRLKVPVDQVRKLVSALRASGELDCILRKSVDD